MRYAIAATVLLAVVVAVVVLGHGDHDSHRGEHCVRDEAYTYFIPAGKALFPMTGTRCAAWAPDGAR